MELPRWRHWQIVVEWVCYHSHLLIGVFTCLWPEQDPLRILLGLRLARLSCVPGIITALFLEIVAIVVVNARTRHLVFILIKLIESPIEHNSTGITRWL